MPTVTSTSAARGASVQTLTYSHTSTTDPLYVAVGYHNTFPAIDYVTFGGVLLERIGRVTGGNLVADWWYLGVPAAGSADIVIVIFGGVTNISSIARNVSGVDLDGIYRNLNSATASSTTPSVNITSAVGDLVLDQVVSDGFNQSFTQGAGQTLDVTQNGIGNTTVKSAGSNEAGAASVTMSWTLSVSDTWLVSGISIPATGTIGAISARTSQFGVELISQQVPSARITQFGVEILSANVAPVVSTEKSYAYIDGIFGLG